MSTYMFRLSTVAAERAAFMNCTQNCMYVQQGTCTHSSHTLGRTCYQDELLIKDRHLLYMHRAEVEAHPGRVTCPHPGSIPHGSRRRTLPRCWCRGPSSCGGQTGTHQGLQMEQMLYFKLSIFAPSNILYDASTAYHFIRYNAFLHSTLHHLTLFPVEMIYSSPTQECPSRST